MKPVLALALGAMALTLSACSPAEEKAPDAAAPQPAAGQAEAPARDQAALDALTRMGDFLRTLDSFELRADTTIDEVADDGQKLQFEGATLYRFRRPDGLYAEVSTDRRVRRFYYDGETFTMYAPRQNFYAQVAATGAVGELLTEIDERYDIEMPLIDLFSWGTERANTDAITSAKHVGFANLDGVETDQYAFRQDGVDWQIWIARGERPLPRKLVITTRDGDANPQYAANLSWNLAPRFSDATFAFRPPPEARLIRINTAETNQETQ
jgi:hypothetical protein